MSILGTFYVRAVDTPFTGAMLIYWQPKRRGLRETCGVYCRSRKSSVEPSQCLVRAKDGHFLNLSPTSSKVGARLAMAEASGK